MLAESIPPPPWQELAARKRQRDLDKIPLQWKLSPQVIQQAKHRRSIADDFLDGLLDSETRLITNWDVPALMAMTGNGSLSAVSLVTAFCKRAAFGHQLVRHPGMVHFTPTEGAYESCAEPQLAPDRIQIGHGEGRVPRRALEHPQATGWTSSRFAHHHEGSIPCEKNGYNNGIRGLDRHV